MKNIAHPLAILLASMLAHAPSAMAQASCSSDGTAQPVAVFERFINADCEACWADPATPVPSESSLSSPGAVVLDWIVPAASGDEAPLSAAAINDALIRLQALGRQVPKATDVYTAPVLPLATPSPRLRVAHGLPFGDYIGTAIAWAPAQHTNTRARSAAHQNGHKNTQATPPGVFRYHLVLVESVPAGTDGTTVPRHIVRNLLEGVWAPSDLRPDSKKPRQRRWMEVRPMQIPQGAQAERLHMVGWVDDAQSRIMAAAQSACR
ncbi:hypothetical protein [Acidovorax radicis]|jgi:hypothetical protein|uniref:hypothetical protein n=1 Tax=Acidovorax radicis TaxID=758826 RepID=UPI001CF9348E|nr:hypothetical protein [Acidovorax radicis]UCV00415.1 hypothetical protein KI609_06455 [Acidovorax radicis]